MTPLYIHWHIFHDYNLAIGILYWSNNPQVTESQLLQQREEKMKAEQQIQSHIQQQLHKLQVEQQQLQQHMRQQQVKQEQLQYMQQPGSQPGSLPPSPQVGTNQFTVSVLQALFSLG